MTRPTHLYRKRFQHQREAQETAAGFHLRPGIDRLGPVDVSVSQDGGAFYVNVALEGEPDPDEVLAATGYERVT